MAVYLASLNDWRNHHGTGYSISIGNMGPAYKRLEFLAPTRELVDEYMYRGRDAIKYTEGYRKIISSRWKEVKRWLRELDKDKDITLMCFCPEGKFCHRQLVGKMINKWRPEIEVIVH